VRDPAAFFGRDEVFAWLELNLPTKPLLLLHGPPRAGLTSVLVQLPVRLANYRFIPVDPTLARSLDALVTLLAKLAGVPENMAETREPVRRLAALLAQIGDRAGAKMPVFVLDDLAAIYTVSQNPAVKSLLALLPALVEHAPRVRFILGTGSAHQVILGEHPDLADWPAHRLGPLKSEPAEELLTRLAGDELAFEYEALKQIVYIAGGWPYILQLIGHAFYEKRRYIERVTTAMVDELLPGLVAQLGRSLEAEWDTFDAQEQLVLSAAVSRRGERGLVTLQGIQALLSAHGTALPMPVIQEILARLVQRGILQPLGSASFRFDTEITRLWLEQRKPLSDVTGKVRPPAVVKPVELRSQRQQRARQILIALSLAVILFILAGGPGWFAAPPAPPGGTPGTAPAYLVATPTRRPIPTVFVPPPQPVIAYQFKPDAKSPWRIHIVTETGADVTPLTDGTADDISPVWSPNGKKIAFVSSRDKNKEVYVMNADGSEQTNLTRHRADDWTPAWSPDGTKIVFSSKRDGNWEIYVMNADGSNPTRLTDEPADDLSPVWSPDGRVIAFASKRDGDWEIYLMNADGSNQLRLTRSPGSDLAPAWSPNGRQIAFESYRDGQMEIYVMNADGTGPRNVSAHRANDHGPAWSPDGTKIVFYSNRGGPWDIYIVNLENKEVTNLTKGAGNAQFPNWRP